MDLLLVRHAQTTGNVAGALDTAHPGADLTPLGEEQAGALAAALAAERVDAVHASPRLRAVRTARAVADPRGLAVVEHPGLVEVAAGDLEGSTDPDDVAAFHGVLAAWFDGRLDERLPGSESGHEVLARFDAALADLLPAGDDGRRAVVVAHGAVLRVWCGLRVPGLEPGWVRDRPLRNTGLVHLVGTPGAWTAAAWDDDVVPDPGPSGPTTTGG